VHDQPLPPVEAVGRPGDQILQPEALGERGQAPERRRRARGGALAAAEVAELADVLCEGFLGLGGFLGGAVSVVIVVVVCSGVRRRGRGG